MAPALDRTTLDRTTLQRELQLALGSPLTLIETHISWVLLGEREVWKIKKPVSMGFLDFGTIEQRKVACEAEVTLNRRLAPDVYLGVLPLYRDPEGHLVLGGPEGEGAGEGDLELVDWVVHMRRLPDCDRADVRLREGRLHREHIDRIARRLAEFHDRARCDEVTAAFGRPEAIAVNVRENFDQTRDSIDRFVTLAQAEEIEHAQEGFLHDRRELLQARIDAGRIRDGHGDLRLEHVYLSDEGSDEGSDDGSDDGSDGSSDGGSDHGSDGSSDGGSDDGSDSAASREGEVTIIDCIEFNDRFRYADVAADLGFLAMDLSEHGHVELSEHLVARYAQHAGDHDLFAVLDFYEGYRAYVRGKISAFVADDPTVDYDRRERAEASARHYFLLALSVERRSLLEPVVIAVAGIIASGKSTVAELLGFEMSAPVVDADRTRKQLLGVHATQPVHDGAWQGAYELSFTEQVYAEVFRRAAVVLASGRPVIVEASFRSRALRDRARALAREHSVPFRLVECRAAPEICRERLRERAKRASVSDGRLEIFDDFVASFEPIDELPADEHLVLDTGAPLHDNLVVLRKALRTWPPGLRG